MTGDTARSPASAPILVAFATRFGSTQEIAEAVGATLRERGAAVEVRRAQDVAAIAQYRAVVVGSPVHRGHLLPEVVELVTRHRAELERVPVALFCCHISQPPQPERDRYLDDIRGLVHPVAEGFFPGRFDRRGAALLIPKVLSWLVPPIDRRNWSKIREWARDVAPLLITEDGSR
jgi:menaquinone-dependent protoporphyrinogen oxidase